MVSRLSVVPLSSIAIMLLTLLLPQAAASAAEIAISLSPRALRGTSPLVVDGAFTFDELEAARISLDGGPAEPVCPQHCDARAKSGSLQEGCPDLSLLFRFSVSDSVNLLDAAYKLSNLPGVEWAEALLDYPRAQEPPAYFSSNLPEPEPVIGLESTEDYIVPNDPYFPLQGSLMHMRFPEAWAISTGSTQVVICSIDGGFTDAHEDLVGAMWDNPEEANGPSDSNGYIGDIHGWNFPADTPFVYDDFHPGAGHGVNCTSVYAARGNNGIGMAGMLWDATVMVTIRDWTDVVLDGAKSAVYAADNGARIAHMAAGSIYSKTGKSMIRYSRSRGLLIYGAAGNEGDFSPRYPVAYRDIVAVAGVDRNDVPMGTNYGYWTGASASLDNEQCITCSPGNVYGHGGGTSIANPYAAGVAALTLSIHQDWDPDLLEAHIRATSVPTDPFSVNIAGEINRYEIGPRVDAYRALSTEPRIEFMPKFWLLEELSTSLPDDRQFVLTLALENTWKAAVNVQMSLSCNDPFVSIAGDTCDLGEMRPLQVLSGPAPFVISVSPDCPANHSCALTLWVNADSLDEPQTFALDVVLNRGMSGRCGWPSEQLDPHLYPPMRADLNGDGVPEIICPTSVACYAYSIDGEKIDEIPVVYGSNAPAIVDLDGDLADEIIFLDPYHRVHVFDDDLGIMTLTDERTWSALSGHYRSCAGHVSTANLCGNAGRQILIKSMNLDNPMGTPVLAALNMDGSFVDGFPIDYFVQSRNIAAADLDGDGIDEVAFFASGAFYVIDNQGEVLPGWPFAVDGFEFNPKGAEIMVSAGDLDGNGEQEILGTLGDTRVFAFKIDGSLMPGWPFEGGNSLFEAHPVLADVNGDGACEIILVEMAPQHDVQLHRTGGIIHVIDSSGKELPGWPLDTGIYYLQPPIACDINGDGKQNILITNSRGVFAYDEAGQVLPGWPIIVAPRALGIYSYSQLTIDDFDEDGTLDIGIPMEGRYFIFKLDGVDAGSAQWGYKGGSADMRYSPVGVQKAPSITIYPEERRLFAGMDTLLADIRIANPGEERTVVASAWIEALGQRFYLPTFSEEEQRFTITLPEHSVIDLPGIVNVPIPDDLPAMDITIVAELIDDSSDEILSSPSTSAHIERYIGPAGGIVVEGLKNASWQTFSYMGSPSSFEPTPLWVFDDGATSSVHSPGHLFESPGEHLLGLILTDERGGQFLATASTFVMEQAGSCPDDMTSMGTFCIDRFEASRPDATAYDFGVESGPAMSVQGVLPWQPAFAPEANLACSLAGKRLCTQDEWQAACTGSFGPLGFEYPYGNVWERYACSDFYTWMDSVTITGKCSRCVSRAGAYDMVGNVRELVTDSRGIPVAVLGGSTYDDPKYPNCQTSQSLELEPWGRVLAYGFRCCKDSD
ncbi:S8 family serine peptidase [bacterium]|nr:S8 family serine peptidase [bacterium]